MGDLLRWCERSGEWSERAYPHRVSMRNAGPSSGTIVPVAGDVGTIVDMYHDTDVRPRLWTVYMYRQQTHILVYGHEHTMQRVKTDEGR